MHIQDSIHVGCIQDLYNKNTGIQTHALPSQNVLCQTTLVFLQGLLDLQQHTRLPVIQLGHLVILIHRASKFLQIGFLACVHKILGEFGFSRRGKCKVFLRKFREELVGGDEVLHEMLITTGIYKARRSLTPIAIEQRAARSQYSLTEYFVRALVKLQSATVWYNSMDFWKSPRSAEISAACW